MTTLTIQDESMVGTVLHTEQIVLPTASEMISVRDLIMTRVTQEVERYNRDANDRIFKGLVQPMELEQLNGEPEFFSRIDDRPKRFVDAEKQCYVALSAFQKNGFIVLINNRQADSLDQMIRVSDETTVGFVKLTPLVGG